MKKKFIIGFLVVVVGLSVLFGARSLAAEERKPEKPQEVGVWEAVLSLKKGVNQAFELIMQLKNQVNELWKRVERVKPVPGPQGIQGVPGPQGSAGPQGPAAARGAGNIAFIFRDANDDIHVLKTDGTVWKWPLFGWAPEGISGINIPVPVSDIVDWQVISFLDKNGDVWRFSNSAWGNYGHP